ncbi:TPA: hypothetical protein L3H17_003723 [Morganella morganii]|nr:hypothetical protein [Morganella morganii]
MSEKMRLVIDNSASPKIIDESLVGFGGGGGGGGNVEARVAKLEADIEHIKASILNIDSTLKSLNVENSKSKTDIAVISSNYATKADVSASANKIILWVVGAVIFSQLLPAMPNIISALTK